MGNKKSRKKRFWTAKQPTKQDNSSSNQELATKPAGSKLMAQRTVAFSGPIPPPELLEKYGLIIPEGADRILKMAESQSIHRQYIEKWAVIGGTVLAYFGVMCAAVIAVFTLYYGSKLILAGHTVSGTIFGGIGLAGIVGAFIYGTRSRKEERLQKYGKKESAQ